MRFFTNLVPLRLELSESASLGDSYYVRRVRLNLMTLAVNSNFYVSERKICEKRHLTDGGAADIIGSELLQKCYKIRTNYAAD